MKKIIAVLLILFAILCSCKVEKPILNSKNSVVLTEGFKNGKLYNIYKKQRFDLLIAYKISSSWESFKNPDPYKILGKRKDKWYKIELYLAGTYRFSKNKDSIAQKKVNEDVYQLLNSYQDNDLYSLTQDYFKQPCLSQKDTIINEEKSIMVHSLGGIVDMPTITFTIINNDRYKSFSCFDPWDAVKICPDIKAYQYVLNMYKAVKKYW